MTHIRAVVEGEENYFDLESMVPCLRMMKEFGGKGCELLLKEGV